MNILVQPDLFSPDTNGGWRNAFREPLVSVSGGLRGQRNGRPTGHGIGRILCRSGHRLEPVLLTQRFCHGCQRTTVRHSPNICLKGFPQGLS